jgi:hypothetical protein
MTATSQSHPTIVALLFLGVIALFTENSRSVSYTTLDHGSDKNSVRKGPWSGIAPRIDVHELPRWIQDYVDFHNQSIAEQNTSSYRYMIYTCKQGHHCSGTGNRQRGIVAAFLVSILTKRIFLMDIDNPIPLELVLEPHMIRWNEIPLNLLEDAPPPLFDIRNIQPNPLQRPCDFATGPQVIRILASGPGGLETIWNSFEMKQLLERTSENMPQLIYKWLFHTLFKPSLALQERVQHQRESLGLTTFSASYVGIHVRLGTSWKGLNEQRYNVTVLPRFLELGQQLQKSHPGKMPLVIISDDARAKEILFEMDPESVRFVSNATIVHVDRSKSLDNGVDGSLQVWADVILLAQATCLVESLSSFSSLARRISISEDEPTRCFVRQDDGMLLKWNHYWGG